MKKLFTLFALLFVLLGSAKAEITNFQTFVDGTEVEFYWQGDTTLSKIYEVGILEVENYDYICYVAAYSNAFVAGTGWYGFSTDLALKYGYNWSDYDGTAAAQYFPKSVWDASVDSLETGELTLKPGMYVVYAEGYDGDYDAVTEDWEYEVIEIAEDVPTDIDELIDSVAVKVKKVMLPNGQLLIMHRDGVFDAFGRKVK